MVSVEFLEMNSQKAKAMESKKERNATIAIVAAFLITASSVSFLALNKSNITNRFNLYSRVVKTPAKKPPAPRSARASMITARFSNSASTSLYHLPMLDMGRSLYTQDRQLREYDDIEIEILDEIARKELDIKRNEETMLSEIIAHVKARKWPKHLFQFPEIEEMLEEDLRELQEELKELPERYEWAVEREKHYAEYDNAETAPTDKPEEPSGP